MSQIIESTEKPNYTRNGNESQLDAWRKVQAGNGADYFWFDETAHPSSKFWPAAAPRYG